MNFGSLGAFASHLAGMASKVTNHRERGLVEAARVVQQEARRALGTYDYGWTPLAEATKDDRVRKGFPADEPGLRRGDMRESIHVVVQGDQAAIGSDDQNLVYFERGTSKQPPRPVLEEAARRREREVQQILSRGLLASIISSVRAP